MNNSNFKVTYPSIIVTKMVTGFCKLIATKKKKKTKKLKILKIKSLNQKINLLDFSI